MLKQNVRGLSARRNTRTISGVTSPLADRVRQRLLDAMSVRRPRLSQRKLAKLLTQDTGVSWNQMDLSRILKGKVRLRFEDVEAMARVIGISLVDLVREPDRELVIDVTPSEMQIFRRLRDSPKWVPIVLDMLRAAEPAIMATPGRRDRRVETKADFWGPDGVYRPPVAADSK